MEISARPGYAGHPTIIDARVATMNLIVNHEEVGHEYKIEAIPVQVPHEDEHRPPVTIGYRVQFISPDGEVMYEDTIIPKENQ